MKEKFAEVTITLLYLGNYLSVIKHSAFSLSNLLEVCANKLTLVFETAVVEVKAETKPPLKLRKWSKSPPTPTPPVFKKLVLMFSDTLEFVTKLSKTVCCSREVFLILKSKFSLAFDELEPAKLIKLESIVFVKANVFDLSWLVKKYFLVVQSRLSSKKSKFCKFAGVALNKLRLLPKVKNSLPKFTF